MEPIPKGSGGRSDGGSGNVSGGGELLVVDKKGVAVTAAQYEDIKRRALESGGGSYGNSFGARFEQILNQRLSDEILGGAVNNLFGRSGGDNSAKGILKSLGDQFILGLGQGVGSRIEGIIDKLGLGRVDAVLGIAASTQGKEYVPPAGNPQQQPQDMNRQLTQKYENAPVREVTPVFGANVQQNYEEFLMSLSPDDADGLQRYGTRKGLFNVPTDEIKRLLIKEQKAYRESMQTPTEKLMGVPVVTGDTWKDESEEPLRTAASPPSEPAKPVNPLEQIMAYLTNVADKTEMIHAEMMEQRKRLNKLEGVKEDITVTSEPMRDKEQRDNTIGSTQETLADKISMSDSSPAEPSVKEEKGEVVGEVNEMVPKKKFIIKHK